MRKQILIITTVAFFVVSIFKVQATDRHLKSGKNQSGKHKQLAVKWAYKREIAIENHGDQKENAVIQVQFSNSDFNYTNAKPDGSDIRFSASESSINGDGLTYWIEQWNQDGISRIWVKVPVIESQGQTSIYMYYGNSQSQPVSSGKNTFLFFDDFKDGDYGKKWKNVSVDSVVEKAGMLKLKGFDNKDGIITADFKVTGQMIVRTLYQRGAADQHWTRAGVGGWNNWLCFGDYTDQAGIGTNYVMFLDGSSTTNLKSKPLIKKPDSIINSKWRRVAYWNDGNSLKGMEDSVTVSWPTINGSSDLALRTLDNDSWDNFAYITVSPGMFPEPIVTMRTQVNN